MSKPDWKDAPEMASWLAQDEDGQWSWWNMAPEPSGGTWGHGYPIHDYRFEDAEYSEVIGDWTKTLEPRP